MTPLMQQFKEMKKKHPDAMLLFRIGDFYECFSDDAITASEVLNITLTRRANGENKYVELAGFPHHALDTYLPKLVRAGKRVAICEQLESPKLAKTTPNDLSPVKRDAYRGKPVDFTPLFLLLSLLQTVMGQLYKFAEIRRKTEEIRILSQELKLPPITAFKCCCAELDKSLQKSLFDNI